MKFYCSPSMLFLSLILCAILPTTTYATTTNHSTNNSVVNIPKEQYLAIEYMKAFTGRNYASLKKFYNRDSQFYDKTANRKYQGARQIVAFLKRAQRGVLDYEFNIDHMFNTGTLVVMIGSYHFRGPGEQFGKPGKIINIAIPGVTSLKTDTMNHRILQHTDLIDYQTMADQLAEQ